jgi:hypothetical protein
VATESFPCAALSGAADVSFEFKEKLSQELGTVVARQLASARSQERYHVSGFAEPAG